MNIAEASNELAILLQSAADDGISLPDYAVCGVYDSTLHKEVRAYMNLTFSDGFGNPDRRKFWVSEWATWFHTNMQSNDTVHGMHHTFSVTFSTQLQLTVGTLVVKTDE